MCFTAFDVFECFLFSDVFGGFRMFFYVFGCVCFVVIGWEIFEYVIYHPFEFLTYGDTIADMVCGLFGGAFAVCTLRFMSFNKIVY